MTKLRALVEEIDAALDIHLSGRSSTRFNRVVYILADDCAELASKLFLQAQNANWQDKMDKGFKNFPAVTDEVAALSPGAASLIAGMKARRAHRNGFFHSTKLLELTLPNHSVDDALLDVIDYCALLFGDAWRDEVAATASMELAEALVRLDRAARSDSHLQGRVNAVLASVPRFGKTTRANTGCAIVFHPSDQHASLAIRYGGNELRDRLRSLMPGQ